MNRCLNGLLGLIVGAPCAGAQSENMRVLLAEGDLVLAKLESDAANDNGMKFAETWLRRVDKAFGPASKELTASVIQQLRALLQALSGQVASAQPGTRSMILGQVASICLSLDQAEGKSDGCWLRLAQECLSLTPNKFIDHEVSRLLAKSSANPEPGASANKPSVQPGVLVPTSGVVAAQPAAETRSAPDWELRVATALESDKTAPSLRVQCCEKLIARFVEKHGDTADDRQDRIEKLIPTLLPELQRGGLAEQLTWGSTICTPANAQCSVSRASDTGWKPCEVWHSTQPVGQQAEQRLFLALTGGTYWVRVSGKSGPSDWIILRGKPTTPAPGYGVKVQVDAVAQSAEAGRVFVDDYSSEPPDRYLLTRQPKSIGDVATAMDKGSLTPDAKEFLRKAWEAIPAGTPTRYEGTPNQLARLRSIDTSVIPGDQAAPLMNWLPRTSPDLQLPPREIAQRLQAIATGDGPLPRLDSGVQILDSSLHDDTAGRLQAGTWVFLDVRRRP